MKKCKRNVTLIINKSTKSKAKKVVGMQFILFFHPTHTSLQISKVTVSLEQEF